jgi:acyl-coenzyme A thioesterase PaaI-like protein
MSAVKPPELAGEPGWEPTMPYPPPVTAGRFVSGEGGGDGHRFQVAWFRRPEDGAMVARAWFGPGAEGPPGHAHGGAIAALLDEAMSAACWSRGHRVLVARLETDFRAPLSLGGVATVEARVERIEGRKLRTSGRLLAPDGRLVAEASGLFVDLTDEQLGAFTRR